MAKQSRQILKSWFVRGAKPTQTQFGDTFDSFVHKDDSIPQDKVEELSNTLEQIQETTERAIAGAIEDVKVNGVSLPKENKSVNIVLHELLPYNDIAKIADYTYRLNCNYLDYAYAKQYFEAGDADIPIGGCSSVKRGNFYGRNYDWFYNNSVDFVVATPHAFGRYATIGFGGFSSKLTAEFVESGEYSDDYKIVPFKIVDGINEKGVVVNVNVVPTQKGETTGTTPLVDTKETLCNMMLPRFILDKFASATEAVNYLRDYVSVYNYNLLGELYHYDLHIMVGDATNTYLIEFVNNAMVITEISDKAFMTNFHLTGVTFNEDGSVYTPLDKDADATCDPISVNNIESHGSGLERYNLINSAYSGITSESAMIQLMNQLIYTNTYKEETNPRWFTEGVGDYESGDVTIGTDLTRFNEVFSIMQELYADRDRNTGKTWQTVHSCVYNINSRSVKVIFQESGDVFEFSVERVAQPDWEQSDATQPDFIKNKPANLVQDADYHHTDNNFTSTEKNKLAGVESGAQKNVQSDWSQNDESQDDYIKNRICYEGGETITDMFPAAQHSDWGGFNYSFNPTVPFENGKTYTLIVEQHGETTVIPTGPSDNSRGSFSGNVDWGQMTLAWNKNNNPQATITINAGYGRQDLAIRLIKKEVGIKTIEKKWMPDDTTYHSELSASASDLNDIMNN